MAREARQLSESNIYHVMLRGNNRQAVFEEDEDRLYFMKVLTRCKEISGFQLHAFVLMPNHVHLLIEPAGEPLDTVFRRIGTRYAVWFNWKYQRTGHLFQDRFRSEAVETDLYFMTVLRYILQNPMKAGLETRPGSYRWSSYRAYQTGKGAVTDTAFAEKLFGGREALASYLIRENDDTVMDEGEPVRRVTDEQAKEILNRTSGCRTVSAFQQLNPALQREYVVKLYQEGLSMTQVSWLTGKSRATVYRIIRKQRDRIAGEEETILRESDSGTGFWDADIIW